MFKRSKFILVFGLLFLIGIASNGTADAGKPPGWWSDFDKIMAQTGSSVPSNPSRMAGLEKHPQCQTDLVAEKVLHNHGRAMLAAMDALAEGNANEVDQQFNEAVKQVSRFAQGLYCLDYGGLYYWDRAISSLWRQVEKQPLPDLTFDEAVIALWNPALLVVDFIQITGQSEIVEVISEMEPKFRMALASYPVDTYGAAWLDKFGTSRLERIEGSFAMHNLVSSLAEPLILGLGQCTLASHGNKSHPAQPCLSGLQLVMDGCTGKAQFDTLSMLQETGLIYALIQATQAIPSDIPAKTSPFPYFGRPNDDLGTNMCALIGNLKPRGLAGLIQQKIGSSRLPPGAGCAFALAMEGLTGAGGEMGGRIIQCLEKHKLKVGVINPIEVRFPVTNCGQTRGQRQWSYGLTGVLRRAKEIGVDLSSYKPENIGSGFSQSQSWFGGIEVFVEGGDGTIRYRFEEGGGLVSITEITANADGSTTQVEDTVWGTSFVRHTDAQGRTTTITVSHSSATWYRDENGNWVKKTEGEDAPDVAQPDDDTSSMPVDPDQGGCGDSPARQRAQAIFNCSFGETDFAETGTLDPWIRPEGPAGPGLPSCNEVSTARFWGSSTGPSVTDPTDPEDFYRAGPTILPSFIPELFGAIDPIPFERDRLRANILKGNISRDR